MCAAQLEHARGLGGGDVDPARRGLDPAAPASAP
jgi:hypothetical protein